MRSFIRFAFFLSVVLLIVSCRNHYIIRNYEYAPEKNCDCYEYKTGIGFMRYTSNRSVATFRKKAICNKINFYEIKDSLSLLNSQRDSLSELVYDYYTAHDSLSWQIARLDSLIPNYYQWTNCKLKIHYRKVNHGDNDTTVTITQKVKFYRSGLFGARKKTAKVKYVNNVVVKFKNKEKRHPHRTSHL